MLVVITGDSFQLFQHEPWWNLWGPPRREKHDCQKNGCKGPQISRPGIVRYIYNYMHNVLLYQSWYIYVYNTIIVYSNTTIIIIVIVISMYIYNTIIYIQIYIYIHEPAKTKCRVLRWFEHTGPPSPFKCNKIAKQKPPLNVSWRCIPLWNGFYTQ